ncbi:MAG TPA: MFS transporter [Solirubrobacterales bacterium]|nr:MFS transporter [Solirubrobacterales bacterium]
MSESRRKRFTLVATIFGSTIVFLDSTVVNVALPALSDDLDAGLADQQWVVEAYLLALVSLLLVGGSLGDQFGRRRLFMVGLVGFGITSIMCGLAPNAEMLIASRALQGFAGALLVPGSLAILAATFEGDERGRAVGTWTAWSGIATVIGPAGGGLLVEAISWRAIFWVNVPLIALTLWIASDAVEESADPDADRRIDWLGIVMSAAGLGGVVFALIQQPTHGWGDPVVYVPLIAGVVLFTLFLVWESRMSYPVLDLSLFKIRNFAVTNLETLIVYAGLIGALFYLTLFLQQTAGYSPLEAGLATTPVSLLLFVLSPRFGKFSMATGPRLPMSVGPIVAGCGLLLLLMVNASPNYVTDVLPGLVLFGVGLSATVAPLTATALNSVDERHVGIASGINNGVSRVAGLLAIAVLGALISGQFGSRLDSELQGVRLSPQGQEAVDDAKADPLPAPDTGALPPSEADPIDSAATVAAEDGFHLGIGVAAGLMVLGGVVAGIGLRNPRREEGREEPRVPLAATAGECSRHTDAGRARDRPEPEQAVT